MGHDAIARILTDQDARRSRVLASFSLRSGAQVPTYVHCAFGAPSPSARAVGLRALRPACWTSCTPAPLRCSRKPRQNPSLTGALAPKISGMARALTGLGPG